MRKLVSKYRFGRRSTERENQSPSIGWKEGGRNEKTRLQVQVWMEEGGKLVSKYRFGGRNTERENQSPSIGLKEGGRNEKTCLQVQV